MSDKTIEERIYSLKLFDYVCPDNISSFRRVPGGWIYGDMQGSTFVPYDNEFQPSGKKLI